jgi:hypothetical protein
MPQKIDANAEKAATARVIGRKVEKPVLELGFVFFIRKSGRRALGDCMMGGMGGFHARRFTAGVRTLLRGGRAQELPRSEESLLNLAVILSNKETLRT